MRLSTMRIQKRLIFAVFFVRLAVLPFLGYNDVLSRKYCGFPRPPTGAGEQEDYVYGNATSHAQVDGCLAG